MNFIMKNKYLFHFAMTMLCWSVFTFSVSSQITTQNLGVVQNGKITLTELQQAERILKVGLSTGAVVSDMRIEFAPLEKRYYLLGKISNDPVSGKALQLHQNGDVLFAATGPGIEISCSGFKCSHCAPNIAGTKPKCACLESSAGSDRYCEMFTKSTIGF